MTNDEIITKLYTSGELKKTINNILFNSSQKQDIQFAEDLEQDIYIKLLEMPQERLSKIYEENQLSYFLVGMVKRNLFSTTSPYYYTYKKYYEKLNDEEDIQTINI